MEIHTRTLPMEQLAELIMLQLENGGRAKLTVTGCSMLPLLHHRRDSVDLIPVSCRQKKGDIILYRRENGQYVLHRIIAIGEKDYICCGDNQAEKERVKQEQLLAVVDGITRKGKYITLDRPGYRLYTAAWVEMFGLRRYYIALRRRLGRFCNRLRKKRIRK